MAFHDRRSPAGDQDRDSGRDRAAEEQVPGEFAAAVGDRPRIARDRGCGSDRVARARGGPGPGGTGRAGRCFAAASAASSRRRCALGRPDRQCSATSARGAAAGPAGAASTHPPAPSGRAPGGRDARRRARSSVPAEEQSRPAARLAAAAPPRPRRRGHALGRRRRLSRRHGLDGDDGGPLIGDGRYGSGFRRTAPARATVARRTSRQQQRPGRRSRSAPRRRGCRGGRAARS